MPLPLRRRPTQRSSATPVCPTGGDGTGRFLCRSSPTMARHGVRRRFANSTRRARPKRCSIYVPVYLVENNRMLRRIFLVPGICSILLIAVTAATPALLAPTPGTGVEREESVDSQLSGEDWPKFLGPYGYGVSRETGLLKSWPPGGPPVVWSRILGPSYSGPVTSRGRLFVFHRLDGKEILECLDARTGADIWQQGYPTTYADRYGYNGGPRASPTVEGNRVYTFGAQGKLTCFDFKTGEVLWQRWINRDYRVMQDQFGAGVAAVIEGDLILLNVGGPQGAGLIAVDKNTGKTAWKASNDGFSYSTPVVRDLNGERLGIFFTRRGLLVVEPQTGRQRYSYYFRSKKVQSVNAASPVVHDNHVFLSATYGTGAVLLKIQPDGPKEIWKDRKAMQNHWATSIYHQGYLYGIDGRHEFGANFRCIEFMTGKIRWRADPGLGRATFIMAEGHLVVLGERGYLALIEISPHHYKEKARVRALDYPCWAPPVLSHGLLYIRSAKQLVCLDLREKE